MDLRGLAYESNHANYSSCPIPWYQYRKHLDDTRMSSESSHTVDIDGRHSDYNMFVEITTVSTVSGQLTIFPKPQLRAFGGIPLWTITIWGDLGWGCYNLPCRSISINIYLFHSISLLKSTVSKQRTSAAINICNFPHCPGCLRPGVYWTEFLWWKYALDDICLMFFGGYHIELFQNPLIMAIPWFFFLSGATHLLNFSKKNSGTGWLVSTPVRAFPTGRS